MNYNVTRSPDWARRGPRNLSLLSTRFPIPSPRSIHNRRERLALHQNQGMIGSAANGTLHVIREVALENAHPSPSVIGYDVSRQGAFVAVLVNGLEVGGHEGRDAVPSVDLAVAFVTEEDRATIVCSQNDYLLRFYSKIVYFALGVAASEMIRSNAEHAAAAQICKEQASATVIVAHQSEIEHVSAVAVQSHRLRKYDAISTTRGHVVHQDRSRGCVGHVDEDAAVWIVVRHDVLESGRGARQTGQIDRFHDLKKRDALSYPVVQHYMIKKSI